jgi:drug/metabolite transporter (DMT)-like permease
VTYFLALLSAALYGAADFVGGLAARRASTLPIVAVSQGAGFTLLLAILPVLPPASPSSADLAWGASAGLTGGIGVALLYRALAIGTMAIVAPVTAVCAVVIPAAAGLILGERLRLLTGLGILLALFAIVLVSQQPPAQEPDASPNTSRDPRRALWLAFASGVAIGLFFLSLARTGAEAGLWPLLAARATSAALFGVLVILTGSTLRLPRTVTWWAVGGGIVDMTANALYLLAAREGPLSVVVTLASLYPASTVILARVTLGERLSRVQYAGVACALLAVLLIVATG